MTYTSMVNIIYPPGLTLASFEYKLKILVLDAKAVVGDFSAGL